MLPPSVETLQSALSATCWEGPGGGGTWLSNTGHSVRIDYVCISMKLMCYTKRAINAREVILATGGEVDHLFATTTRCNAKEIMWQKTMPMHPVLKVPQLRETIEEEWTAAPPILQHISIDDTAKQAGEMFTPVLGSALSTHKGRPK